MSIFASETDLLNALDRHDELVRQCVAGILNFDVFCERYNDFYASMHSMATNPILRSATYSRSMSIEFGRTSSSRTKYLAAFARTLTRSWIVTGWLGGFPRGRQGKCFRKFNFQALPMQRSNLLVKRTCASYAGWSAYRER